MTIPAHRIPVSRSKAPSGRRDVARHTAGVRFEALGPLVALADRAPVAMPPAQRRLLATLLLSPGVAQSTDALIDQMWNEEPPKTATQAIHVHLSALRRRMPGVIAARDRGYVVDLDHHEFDVAEFTSLAGTAEEHLAAGRLRDAGEAAGRAAGLWRGEPYLEVADLEVARGERERLFELWLGARTTEARALALQGRLSESIGRLRRLVTEQPLNEPLWEELVLAYCMAGRMAEARASLTRARALLSDELDVAPGRRLLELERRVEHQDPALVEVAATTVPHNLPLIDSTFVGRDADVAMVGDLLRNRHLVTLTGPPGIGKTRLAIEMAARTLGQHPAGAWLVRLAGTRTAADVLASVASVMGIEGSVEEPGPLYRSVASRPALLVLDNCEHVLDEVRALLADRRHGDRLRILATSRSPLHIGEETVWALHPISMPESIETMWGSATLRLLADRVAGADPRIALDRADPELLIELCRRTGGMPLAVELVASRAATLDLRRVRSMTFAGTRRESDAALPLEPSVAGAIERSVSLLQPADRRRFAAAAVFVSGFGADAFEQVCLGRSGDRIDDDVVRRLAEASLLVLERASDDRVRYRMLEPIRDFGLRRLAAGRRERAVRDRHAAWFVAAARGAAEASWTDAEATTLDAVEASADDYRAAMRHLLDTGRPHLAAEIAAGLAQFWISRFLAWEGRRWLSECLAAEMDVARRIRVLAAASGVAFFTARYDESESLCDGVLELARRHGDRRHEAQALYGKGRVRIHRQPAEGRALVEQAIAAYDEVGDRVAAAECRVVIGMQAAYAADRVEADAILGEATAILDAEGYPRIASVGHRHLSMAAWHDDDEVSARRHVVAAMDLAQRANDRRVLAGALAQQSMVEGRWGEPVAAAAAAMEALKLIAGQQGMYFSLVAFGALELLVARGEWAMAAQLLAHFDRVHREYGWIPLDERNAAAPVYRRRIAAALARTGERPDLVPVGTPAMAARLLTTLEAIRNVPAGSGREGRARPA